jgi:hypothetical protein
LGVLAIADPYQRAATASIAAQQHSLAQGAIRRHIGFPGEEDQPHAL